VKPGSLELLNRKLPLQNRRFKWWEHVTREDYDCTGAEYVFWYYETGDRVKKLNGYMEKGGYLIRKRESLNQERREKR